MAERPTYSREEMDAILKRALERQQAKNEGIAHEDLVAAAAEVGIAREEVEAAALEVRLREREAITGPPEAGVEKARALRRAERSFVVWLVVCVGLFVVARATDSNWWIWVAGPWGIAVALQWVGVVFPHQGGDAREGRRRRREERRDERQREFEHRVELGADAILRVMDEIRDARARDDVRARVADEDEGDARVEERDTDGITNQETPIARKSRRQ